MGETTGTWSEVNYWRANFTVNGITSVKLFDSAHGLLESHNVNLPDITQPLSSYNGFNPLSLSWEKQADGILLSWDGINLTLVLLIVLNSLLRVGHIASSNISTEQRILFMFQIHYLSL